MNSHSIKRVDLIFNGRLLGEKEKMRGIQPHLKNVYPGSWPS
jgi:hypothetical protein